MSKKTIYIDYSKCIGCETCEYVCRFVHETPRIHMVRTTTGMMAPLYCRHCEDPKCAKACTKGALVRDSDGALILQTMLCRGCTTRNCLLACPYAALLETDKGVMIAKCDLCAKRRSLGMLPACSEMCPCGAIHYIDRDALDTVETDEAKQAHEILHKHIRNP